MEHAKKHTFILLSSGIFIPILYVAADIICAYNYPNYSYSDQAISELSAIGAPTTHLWKMLTALYSPAVIAFGIGVLRVARNRNLRVSGILIVIFGISDYAWRFFPMNMRGHIGSISDTGHLVLSAVTVLILTLFIAYGSGAFGKLFRIYSLGTIAVMLAFGTLVGMDAPKVAAQLPTPFMGIYERISVFSPMIWMLVLATLLIQKNSPTRGM